MILMIPSLTISQPSDSLGNKQINKYWDISQNILPVTSHEGKLNSDSIFFFGQTVILMLIQIWKLKIAL